MTGTRRESVEEPVEAPRAVIDGILRVRHNGVTNMFMRDDVARLARARGDHAAAEWVEANHDLYGFAIMHGMIDADTGERVPADHDPDAGPDAGPDDAANGE